MWFDGLELINIEVYKPYKPKHQMQWNVFYYSAADKKIKALNIFDHTNFSKAVDRKLKSCRDKNEFASRLHSELMYYFWCKSEYEILIKAWCGSKEEIKVDVYTQIMLNWNKFVKYVWSFRKEK